MHNFVILTINPGSTSTKIAISENETELFCQSVEHTSTDSVEHTSTDLESFLTVNEQFEFRKMTVQKMSAGRKRNGSPDSGWTAVVKRGRRASDIWRLVGHAFIKISLISKCIRSVKVVTSLSNIQANR